MVLTESCDSTPMTSLCKDCDVIVHESMLENEIFEEAISKGHSTPGELRMRLAIIYNSLHPLPLW